MGKSADECQHSHPQHSSSWHLWSGGTLAKTWRSGWATISDHGVAVWSRKTIALTTQVGKGHAGHRLHQVGPCDHPPREAPNWQHRPGEHEPEQQQTEWRADRVNRQRKRPKGLRRSDAGLWGRAQLPGEKPLQHLQHWNQPVKVQVVTIDAQLHSGKCHVPWGHPYPYLWHSASSPYTKPANQ